MRSENREDVAFKISALSDRTTEEERGKNKNGGFHDIFRPVRVPPLLEN